MIEIDHRAWESNTVSNQLPRCAIFSMKRPLKKKKKRKSSLNGANDKAANLLYLLIN